MDRDPVLHGHGSGTLKIKSGGLTASNHNETQLRALRIKSGGIIVQG